MECTLSTGYTKLFAKTVQCLGKIGEDMFIEAHQDRIILRTLNSSRVAFFAFHLHRGFFDHLSLEDNQERKFAIKLKPCQAVFRAYDTIEKCILRLDLIQERFVFELHCKHGVKKLYKLTYEEIQPVSAVYDKDSCPNRLVCVPRKLLEAVSNFHSSVEEITLSTGKTHLRFRSHSEDTTAGRATQLLRTETTLDAADFDEYQVGETDITFCLKEFKALLGFCESAGQPVVVHFDRAGRPALASLTYFNIFEADFVLATLLDPNRRSTPDANSSPSSSPQTSNTSLIKTPHTNTSSMPSRKRASPDSSPTRGPSPTRSSPTRSSPTRSGPSSPSVIITSGSGGDTEGEDEMDYETIPLSPARG
ncbi:cell cycle checkpoint control protein RAD9B-like [Planoprotostelium fungivorum]|uniref:Cell cycle checkpoint control protein RAD9A n=1 Tax=Planoprotostelium fungivorum TaxID=1890364 RepID=A0A2P6N567_9EUKA|nr:cell cycle checkpoint control protein RAD9B-like [Planoprotostelium fungivorum]